MSKTRRYNSSSVLTFGAISSILSQLEQQFKEELCTIDSESATSYQKTRGKLLGLRVFHSEVIQYLEKRDVEDFIEDTYQGDIDEF